MPIQSKEMGVSGECDLVEFIRDDQGVVVFGDRYMVIPVEYKKGSPLDRNGQESRKTEANALQLVAQAMCLEEMLCCTIPFGYLYYGEIKRRIQEEITPDRRERVREIFREMHQHMRRGYTPMVKRSKSCNACSLKDVCLPVLEKKRSATNYLERKIAEE
jgi:CRISPR-associated exonuclease Cas4